MMDPYIFTIITISGWSFFIITIISILSCVNKFVGIRKRSSLYEHYPKILTIFDRARETAYQKIFREQVIVQSASGFKVNQEEIIKMQSQYVKIVFTYCGDNIINDIKEIHGSLDALTSFLASELMVKIENDEVFIIDKFNKDDKSKSYMGVMNG